MLINPPLHTAGASADAWLAENTTLCTRHQARITLTACEANRDRTGDNFRCAGCGGLHDQQLPKASAVAITTLYPAVPTVDLDPLSRAFVAMLQEILHGHYDVYADDLNDEEPDDEDLAIATLKSVDTAALDPFTELILADLQGLNEEESPQVKRIELVELPERKRRVWVFTGRCPRCRGYMVHGAKEYHDGVVDDEVYRCFNCGWKTSPGYDYNRKNPGSGWR